MAGKDYSAIQGRMLAQYYDRVPQLERENRRLRRLVLLLLLAGTVQWLLQWL
jgi:hypothetical protein